MLKTIRAPFSLEQVVALNAFQRAGAFHSFTCANEHDHSVDLVAGVGGWTCPDCRYSQDWAYEFMSIPACEFCGIAEPPLSVSNDLVISCKDCVRVTA